MSQELSRLVQIFCAKPIVGEMLSHFWRRVLEVLGVPEPAIVKSELLGLYQDLLLGQFLSWELASKPCPTGR